MPGVRLGALDPHQVARAPSRPPAGGYTRRGFLGVAGAAVLMCGCGADEAAKEPPGDAEVLAGLLAIERTLVGTMTGSPALRDQDRRHADRLARELAARGGDPARVRPRPEPIGKQAALFAYVEAIPRFTDPDLRVLVQQIAASEAAHLVALRLESGREPVLDAFAGFAP